MLGPRLAHPAVIALLARYCCPQRLKSAGCGHARTLLKKHAPRLAEKLTEEIFTASAKQTVTVTGTSAAEKTIGRLTEQLSLLGAQRAAIKTEILTVVDAHPLTQVLTTMPGVGVRTPARIPTEVIEKDTLKRALFLSAFASINTSPASRVYYDRKRAEGKPHNKAIIALTTRRTDILYPMLQDGTSYHEPTTPTMALTVQQSSILLDEGFRKSVADGQ